MERSKLCGVILAGGNSLRMGRDKAMIEVEGSPLIERQARLLRGRVAELLISSNEPEAYAFLGLPAIRDLYPRAGPLAGLHAAMLHSHLELFLVVACDMPRISHALLDSLIQGADGYDAVVPESSDGMTHPLCAAYRRTCLSVIQGNLQRGLYRFQALLDGQSLRVRRLRPADGGFRDADLINLNVPADLSGYLSSD